MTMPDDVPIEGPCDVTLYESVKTPARPRGFATMTPEQRTAIARRGGVAAHKKGTAHEFTKEEASVAGKKGARATFEKRKANASEKPSNDTGV